MHDDIDSFATACGRPAEPRTAIRGKADGAQSAGAKNSSEQIDEDGEKPVASERCRRFAGPGPRCISKFVRANY